MNERLKDLAIKAQVEHCISHVRLQEFAELIVRQCAMKANSMAIDLRNDYDLDAKTYVGDSILKAFGIQK